ncbi:hypothetical protein PSPO01_11813 [Paraphaeosphaeria sporulosa]
MLHTLNNKKQRDATAKSDRRMRSRARAHAWVDEWVAVEYAPSGRIPTSLLCLALAFREAALGLATDRQQLAAVYPRRAPDAPRASGLEIAASRSDGAFGGATINETVEERRSRETRGRRGERKECGVMSVDPRAPWQAS